MIFGFEKSRIETRIRQSFEIERNDGKKKNNRAKQMKKANDGSLKSSTLSRSPQPSSKHSQLLVKRRFLSAGGDLTLILNSLLSLGRHLSPTTGHPNDAILKFGLTSRRENRELEYTGEGWGRLNSPYHIVVSDKRESHEKHKGREQWATHEELPVWGK